VIPEFWYICEKCGEAFHDDYLDPEEDELLCEKCYSEEND